MIVAESLRDSGPCVMENLFFVFGPESRRDSATLLVIDDEFLGVNQSPHEILEATGQAALFDDILGSSRQFFGCGESTEGPQISRLDKRFHRFRFDFLRGVLLRSN